MVIFPMDVTAIMSSGLSNNFVNSRNRKKRIKLNWQKWRRRQGSEG
jgi:hypothetical protein